MELEVLMNGVCVPDEDEVLSLDELYLLPCLGEIGDNLGGCLSGHIKAREDEIPEDADSGEMEPESEDILESLLRDIFFCS